MDQGKILTYMSFEINLDNRWRNKQMVEDNRKCIGCGKKVPSRMRDTLTKRGWSFIQVEIMGPRSERRIQYFSNCGCLEHEDFVAETSKRYLAKA